MNFYVRVIISLLISSPLMSWMGSSLAVQNKDTPLKLESSRVVQNKKRRNSPIDANRWRELHHLVGIQLEKCVDFKTYKVAVLRSKLTPAQRKDWQRAISKLSRARFKNILSKNSFA